MPGAPTFNVASAYSSYPAPSSPSAAGSKSHTSFLVWLVLLGVVLPVVILGGLKVGGFSFVFKGR